MTANNRSLADQEEVERRVADLLERRAQRLIVEPDLDRLMASPNDGATLLAAPQTMAERSRRRWMFAAAAALLVVAGLGAMARYRGEANTDVATSSLIGTAAESGALQGFMASAAPEAVDYELRVWMSPDASPDSLASMVELLTASAAVDHFSYVDTATTYNEFTAYYADQPEVIELVEPDMLPTSFLIETSIPEELAAHLAGQPYVSGVDTVGAVPDD